MGSGHLTYSPVVALKGNAQIKTPVCLPVGQQGAEVCDGYMILRADEAEFDEKTGEIRPHGNVVVTPLYQEKKKVIPIETSRTGFGYDIDHMEVFIEKV